MPSPCRTLSFSSIFNYEAYANDTRDDDSESHDEKPPVVDRVSEAASCDPHPSPLHDVLNLVVDDGSVPASSGAERPAPEAPLRGLFFDDEENMLMAYSRRESTPQVLDARPPTAGPSRTASQSSALRALQRIDSSFGSEFDGSDAAVYGGSEREEGSVLLEDDGEEEGLEPFEELPCDEDDGKDAEGSPSESGEEAFEEEGPEDGAEPQGGNSLGEAVAVDEATAEDVSQDVPPPPSPMSGPSFGLRRSTRVRTRPAQFTPPPPPSSPKKVKGKGKAVAREPRSPAPSKRASRKRARSPSSGDSADAPSGSSSRPSKRHRPSPAQIQEAYVLPQDVPTDVQCAVVGCEEMFSLHNVAALSGHFSKHYSEAERDDEVCPLVPCRWGADCKKVAVYTEVVRHLKESHLKLRARCDRCGETFTRHASATRHKETACKGPRLGSDSSKKGKERQK